NLDWGGEGVVFAVGWPGQWSAEFQRNDTDGLRLGCGQETTHLVLHSGETIRTPLMALQFWTGQWPDAQNVWRAWLLKHNLPKPGGKPLLPMLSGQSGYAHAWM